VLARELPPLGVTVVYHAAAAAAAAAGGGGGGGGDAQIFNISLTFHPSVQKLSPLTHS
jgi:hypothetical protein